jgi:tryptophan-rich sensory protein
MNKTDFCYGLLAVFLTEMVGFFGAFSISQETLVDWYNNLVISPYSPPNWIFGAVWPMLYITIGIAGYLLYKKSSKNKKTSRCFSLFLMNMIFNGLWPFCFFYLRNTTLGLIDILFVVITLGLLLCSSYAVDKRATYLLIPYSMWLGFATYLQVYIWYMN